MFWSSQWTISWCRPRLQVALPTEEKDQEDHKFESRWQLMEWLLLYSWKVSGL